MQLQRCRGSVAEVQRWCRGGAVGAQMRCRGAVAEVQMRCRGAVVQWCSGADEVQRFRGSEVQVVQMRCSGEWCK